MNAHDEEPAVPGVSGKRLTRGLILLMAVALFAIIFFFANLARLESLRTQTGQQWRVLASELDHRFRAAEALADSNVSDTGVLTELHHSADQFRTATNMEDQFALAERTEQLLRQLDSSAAWLPPITDQLSDVIAAYNESIQQERALYDSLAGRFVNTIVSLAPRHRWDSAIGDRN